MARKSMMALVETMYRNRPQNQWLILFILNTNPNPQQVFNGEKDHRKQLEIDENRANRSIVFRLRYGAQWQWHSA